MSMGVIYEPTTFTPRQANGFHVADVGRLIRMLKTLYVANPYGFSAQQKAGPLVALVDALTAAGAEVWEPFARNNQFDRTTPGWAYQISQADLRDVRDADGLFAVVNGCPPDEGVMVELGMAIAWHKPTFLFRDDFRRCTDSEVYPLNLMLFAGLPETGWEAHWYSAVEEIADPGRMLKTLYVANPYGFSAQQKAGPLVALVDALTAAGAEVWEPFARNNQFDRTTPGWAYQISQADLRDVRDADGLFAVVNGCPPDEGVMVELGVAIAWHKPTFLFRDDFRRCTDSEVYPLNLMLFAGLPETGWEAHWYSAVEEIADPGKALARWLNDGASPGAPR